MPRGEKLEGEEMLIIPDPDTGEHMLYKVYKEGELTKIREQTTGKSEGVMIVVENKHYVAFTKPKFKILELEGTKIDQNIMALKILEPEETKIDQNIMTLHSCSVKPTLT